MLVLLAIIFFVIDRARPWLGISAIVLACFALVRFFLFARNYGRELLVQFIELPA